jgi:hypothetical protein
MRIAGCKRHRPVECGQGATLIIGLAEKAADRIEQHGIGRRMALRGGGGFAGIRQLPLRQQGLCPLQQHFRVAQVIHRKRPPRLRRIHFALNE